MQRRMMRSTQITVLAGFPAHARPTQAEVEDMIWEVDEDCDQALTWPEFQAMYQRCRNDQTGAPCAHPCHGLVPSLFWGAYEGETLYGMLKSVDWEAAQSTITGCAVT